MLTARWQVLFVVVDVGADNSHVLQYFGLRAEEAPALRFINMETTKKYMPADQGLVTAASVAAFCHSVLGGKVKVRAGWPTHGVCGGNSSSQERPPMKQLAWFPPQPYLLSQEIPPDWDQRPVKTLVGKNFEQVAFDETKNVFVKFCEWGGQWMVGGGQYGVQLAVPTPPCPRCPLVHPLQGDGTGLGGTG